MACSATIYHVRVLVEKFHSQHNKGEKHERERENLDRANESHTSRVKNKFWFCCSYFISFKEFASPDVSTT